TIRMAIVQTRPGEPFDRTRIGNDLRSLHRTQYFEYIQVLERDGDIGKIITFEVREKPLIRRIVYEGNKSFTEADILDTFKEMKVGLSPDSQYDPVRVKAAERALRTLLVTNGKPLGTVHSFVDPIPPVSVGIRFVIDEGPNVRIGRITFTGNTVFTDRELRNALELNKEQSLFTLFKKTDRYHEERLQYDVSSNLMALYQQHGYMQARIGRPLVRIFEGPRGNIPFLRKTRQQFYIEIPVDAGPQYRLGDLKLTNCGIMNCDALVEIFGMERGEIVNFKRIQDTLESIKELYGHHGFINFSYIPEVSYDHENKIYNVTFELQPDKQFFVRRINFKGNTKTRDSVIRREFILEEGRLFNSFALDNSIVRLNQLGIFERIEEEDYEVRPNEKTGTVDVDVNLKEQSQQSIGFSAGVSGISGSFVAVNYSTNNLFGRGSSMDVNITGGTRQTNFVLSYTEPYFLDSPWRMGISVFNQRYRYDSYGAYGMLDYTGSSMELFTQRSMGTTFTVNRRIARTLWSFGGTYTFQNIGVDNIASGFETMALSQFQGYLSDFTASRSIKGILRSEVTPIINYNSTNAFFNPTRGTNFVLSTAFAGGFIGGDLNLFRPTAQYQRFIADRWLSRGRNVFAFNLQFQHIRSFGGSNIPFFDRFFIGGENTIRGFDIRSISPIAITSTRMLDVRGNPIIDLKTGLPQISQSSPFAVGGDTIGILNFEYRIPIAGPLSLAAFYDLGLSHASRREAIGNFGASTVDIISSTNNTVRGSTGFEVQFIMPVVNAPFRLIFAYNPQRLDQTISTPSGVFRIQDPRSDIKFTVGRSF
ncbi:MAG TPA: outer membrane protein assembly factor BamA, partial [Acidobacteriota bacterium]|nr:outer membrane protein assembly factor BamA [Acidobacteriota bacterium]